MNQQRADLPNLHDAVLKQIEIDWEEGTAAVYEPQLTAQMRSLDG